MARYAVPGSKWEGSIREMWVYPLGAPPTFAMTFVKVSPLSWLTWRLPSSVPTQITPGRDGDSRTCVAVELVEYPSCFDGIGFLTPTPMIGMSGAQRLIFFVRSVLFIHHVSPRLFDLKKNCDAM